MKARPLGGGIVMNGPFGTYLGASIFFFKQFTSHVVPIVLHCIVTRPWFVSTIAPIVPISLLSCTLLFSLVFHVHSYLLSLEPIVLYMYIRPVLRYLETSVLTSCLQVSLAVFSLISYLLNTSCLQPDCRALLRSRCTSARQRPCSSRKPPP